MDTCSIHTAILLKCTAAFQRDFVPPCTGKRERDKAQRIHIYLIISGNRAITDMTVNTLNDFVKPI